MATGPISLTANDVSPIGNVLSTSLVTAPSHGTVVVNGDQTITFTGAAGGDTFQLLYANFTTAPINYSSTPATLQANIQSALSTLVASTPITGLGTPVVSATSATSVTVTFNSATSVTEPPISIFNGVFVAGSASVASQGTFVYTPVTGYLGPDSFTYSDTDPTTGLTGNAATVNLNVTPRLSIPSNLVIPSVPGTTFAVPVMLDNPNPTGSGGLSAASEAINFNPAVLQEVSVSLDRPPPIPVPCKRSPSGRESPTATRLRWFSPDLSPRLARSPQ